MGVTETEIVESPQFLDTSCMMRSWANTNPATRGIAAVHLRMWEGGLRVRVVGASENKAFDWGEVEVEAVYADSPSSTRGMSFVARYNFGFLETLLEGNVNAGLLVLAAFHTFRDGSNRSNYFSREFFFETGR